MYYVIDIIHYILYIIMLIYIIIWYPGSWLYISIFKCTLYVIILVLFY